MIKNRVAKYKDHISLEHNDLILEGFTVAFEALKHWKEDGKRINGTNVYSWAWIYIESHLRSLAEKDMGSLMDEEISIEDVPGNSCIESMVEKEGDNFFQELSSSLPEKHKSVIGNTFEPHTSAKEAAYDLGITKQRVSQMRKEALKAIKSELRD